MNNHLLKLLSLIAIIAITVFSCKNDDDISIPDTDIVTPPDLEPNVDLTFVKNLDDGTIIDFNTVQNSGELITSGFIISSDVADNINNQLYIQDKAENAESGVIIDIAVNDMYLTHAVGRNIILKLNGLGMQKIDNALHIGILENGALSPMDSNDFEKFVFRTSTLATIVPKKLTIDEILQASASTGQDDDISTILIRIDKVQIVNDELGASYANPDNNETVLRTLMECNNQTIKLQNSGLSNFKALPFPTEKGPITAILTKDILTIRDTGDINFTASRCENRALIDEDFEGISPVGISIALDGWININNKIIETDPISSNRWKSDINNNNIFAEITSTGSTTQYDAWLITPELTIVTEKTLTISMDINVSEHSGDNLEIFIVNGVINDEVTIGEAITIVPDGNTTGLNSLETTITISDDQDTFRIGFRYRKETGTATTDYQIDNLKVVEQ